MDEYRKHGHRIVTLKRLRAYIKTFRNLFSPIIDSYRKTIRDSAKLIASLIQDSFGTCISSKIRNFVKKIWNKCHKALSHQALVTVFYNSTPFIRSLLSFFEDNNADIMDAFLLPKKTKSSLILC